MSGHVTFVHKQFYIDGAENDMSGHKTYVH